MDAFALEKLVFPVDLGVLSAGFAACALGNAGGALGADSLLEDAIYFFAASLLCYSVLDVFEFAVSGFFGIDVGFSTLASFFA